MEEKETAIDNNDLSTPSNEQEDPHAAKFKLNISKKTLVLIVWLSVLIILFVTGFITFSGKFEQTTPSTTNESQELTQQANVDPNRNSNYNPSTEGKITLNWTPDHVNTFHSTYYLFGEITTDGDLFHVDLYQNGELIDGYTIKENNSHLILNYGASNSGFVTDKSRTHKKFYFPVSDLAMGNSTVSVKLYSGDSKENLLDEKSFSITRSGTTYSSDLTMYNIPQQADAKQVFDKVGIDFENENLAEYFHKLSTRYFGDNTNDFFYGKTRDWIDYKLEIMGEIGINNQKTPLYRLFYTYPSGGPGVYNNSFYFYIVDNRAYFITNTLVSDLYVAPIYLFYMQPSPYVFKETVAELENIPINDNSVLIPSNTGAGGLEYCDSIKVEGYKLYTYKSFTVYKNLDVYDQYGHCKNFRLVSSYFKDDKYLGNWGWNERINPDFNKMNISFDDGKNSESFYSPYWYWCAGSRGYRTLDKGDYLEKVGKTQTGEDVYIYSKNMPFPTDNHLLPASTKEYPNYLVTEADWQEFLNKQKETYPVLIIKNAFGDWVVYINADNFFVPGC